MMSRNGWWNPSINLGELLVNLTTDILASLLKKNAVDDSKKQGLFTHFLRIETSTLLTRYLRDDLLDEVRMIGTTIYLCKNNTSTLSTLRRIDQQARLFRYTIFFLKTNNILRSPNVCVGKDRRMT
jgi:hypothetical protein